MPSLPLLQKKLIICQDTIGFFFWLSPLSSNTVVRHPVTVYS